MHKITTIGEHSICLDLLPAIANILDGGCRGFDISKQFKGKEGINVVNVDISDLPVKTKKEILYTDYTRETIYDGYPDFSYIRAGISNYIGSGAVNINLSDPQATTLGRLTPHDVDVVSVFTTEKLKQLLNIEWWDYIKLDVEGEEYKILETNLHPMATQVSVEFHEHTHRAIGKEKLDALLDHLSQWYDIYNRNWESRHCAGFNYWDVLLIAKKEWI